MSDEPSNFLLRNYLLFNMRVEKPDSTIAMLVFCRSNNSIILKGAENVEELQVELSPYPVKVLSAFSLPSLPSGPESIWLGTN